MNIPGPGKKAMMKKAIQEMDPHDMEAAQLMAETIAEVEARQLQALNRVSEAAGLETGHNLDVPARSTLLLDFADALSNGNLKDWYFGEYQGHGLENADSAKNLAGLDRDAWRDQITDWADRYRAESPDAVADKTDAEIAHMHVLTVFNVGLDEFSEGVIEWTVGTAIEEVLLGNLLHIEAMMLEAADQIEDAK